MSASYEVVSEGQWPSGEEKPLAVLRESVAGLERRLGARFLPGEDDLGEFRQLGLRLGSGRLVLMSRHREEPGEGVSAYVDGADRSQEALAEFKSALGLDTEDFVWVAGGPSGSSDEG